jgi:cyclopropane fatty-acyl-phospholipid synthase-like methyltransferase
MFSNVISKNLRQPNGLIGKYIGMRLKSNLAVYNELESIVDLNNINIALEIGYGPGYGIKNYASKYNCIIHGIDFSKTMFQSASKMNRKKISEGKVKLLFGNFNEYDDKPTKYDLVYLINVIYFWNEIQHNIQKIYNLLSDNGQIAIFMDSPQMLKSNKLISTSIFNLHKTDDVINVMRSIGFIEIEKKEYSQYKGCFYLIGRREI